MGQSKSKINKIKTDKSVFILKTFFFSVKLLIIN